MNLKTSLSKEYWPALQIALVFQVIFLILGGLMLDGGLCAQFVFFSLLAWWGGFGIMAFRRPLNPTKVDLFLIRWSFPVVSFFIVPLLSTLIWRARGVWPP
jgi:hypothetical protein